MLINSVTLLGAEDVREGQGKAHFRFSDLISLFHSKYQMKEVGFYISCAKIHTVYNSTI